MAFYYPGNHIGLLLIHGFCGSPYDMHHLGQYLHQQGFTVRGIQLAGHGSGNPRDLAKITYKQWVQSAAEGLAKLQENSAQVYCIGFSMGGTIALHLAAHYPIKGLITICAPIRIKPVFHIRRARHYLWQRQKILLKDPEARKKRQTYPWAPLNAFYQLFSLLKTVRPEISNITAPSLLIQSAQDNLIDPNNVHEIDSKLTNVRTKRILYVKNSGHIAPLDYDKEILNQEIANFIVNTQKTR